MGVYLDNFLSLIPESQKIRLEEALLKEAEVKRNNVTVENIISKIKDYKKVFEVSSQGEFLNSEIYNNAIVEIFSDLSVLFSKLELIDLAIINNNMLSLSNIETLRKELDNIRVQIHSLKIAIETPETTVVKIENFNSNSFLETRSEQMSHLFTDRDGSIIAENFMVHIDTVREGQCKLSTIESIDTLRDNDGYLTANIKRISDKTRTQGNPNYPIVNAIDGSLETFWGEVALCDDVLNTPIGDVSEGAIATFEIILDRPRVINEISIDIFGNYPIDIISIQCYEDINVEVLPSYIVGPELTNTTKQISEGSTITFLPTVAKRLVFTLRQKSYDKIQYLVRESSANKKDLWEEITTKHIEHTLAHIRDIEENIISPIEIQSVLDELSGWNAYLKQYEKELQEWYDNPWV